jgi:Ca2+-binding RTX toxin-like protein
MSIIEVQVARSKEAQAAPQGRDRFEDKTLERTSQVPFYVGFGIGALLLYLKSSLVPWAEAHEGPQEHGLNNERPQAQIAPDDLTAELANFVNPNPVDLIASRQMPKMVQHSTVRALDHYSLNPFATSFNIDAVDLRYRPPAESLMMRTGAAVNFPVSPHNDNGIRSSSSINTGNHGAGGGTDTGDDGEKDTAGDPTPTPKKNQAPKVSGPVYLSDQFVCTMVMVSIADLLRKATDADAGNILSVKDVRVNGVLLDQMNGQYYYHGEELGPVTIKYLVTDGLLSVAETAIINLLEKPPILGTSDDDILPGSACDDDISGGDGDDRIDGKGGDDVIYGGCGNDHIVGGDGDDVIDGEDGDDIIVGGSGDDVLFGGNGNDQLFGDAGNDILLGGAAYDTLYGGAGHDVIDGGSGRDWIYDGLGSDDVDGGTGNDTFYASADSANDLYNGNTGIDKLSYAQSLSNLLFNLPQGVVSGADIGSDQVANFEIFEGGKGNDTFKALLQPATPATPATQSHTYIGGAGLDTLDYSTARQAITIDLARKTVQGAELATDYFETIESFVTGSGNDTFIAGGHGSALHMVIVDEPDVSEASDCNVGEENSPNALNPIIVTNSPVGDAAAGDQTLAGGDGYDTLDYSDATHSIIVNVAESHATGQDIGTDIFSGIEHFVGGAGDDTFIVGQGMFTLDGRGGNDMFQFLAPTAMESDETSSHHIQGFEVGDWVRMSKYDIFDNAVSAIEDTFNKVYGDAQAGADSQSTQDLVAPIRIRYELSSDVHNTFIDADLDQNGSYETTIQIDGDHHLQIVDNHLA